MKQKEVDIHALSSFNASTEALAEAGGIYDTYIEYAVSRALGDEDRKAKLTGACLVTMSNNPVLRGENATLLEISRSEPGGGEARSMLLVSNRPECSVGCWTVPWQATGAWDSRGEAPLDAAAGKISFKREAHRKSWLLSVFESKSLACRLELFHGSSS